MLDALRSFFDEMTGGTQPADAFAADDYRLAAVALLVHLANADGVVDEAERQRLHRLVEGRFALSTAEASQLIAQASTQEREAVDLFHFTRILKRRLDEAGRQAVVAALWEVAYADGAVHEFEENIVARVAELLGVSPREKVELRQKAEREGPEDVSAAGPWGLRSVAP